MLCRVLKRIREILAIAAEKGGGLWTLRTYICVEKYKWTTTQRDVEFIMCCDEHLWGYVCNLNKL